MHDAAPIPRPEKEVLDECVSCLEGRTVDQVWYREIDYQGDKEQDDLPLWQRGEDFERVFTDFYLVSGETTFRFQTGGVTRMKGLDVTEHPEAMLDAFDEYGVLNEVSDASSSSGWRAFVGGRITEARLFWHWRDYGIGHWQCPRDLALTFDDRRTVHVTAAVLGDEGYEMEQVSTVFEEEAAARYGLGSHAAPASLPGETVCIPPEAPGPWVIEALGAKKLKGRTVQQVWSEKIEDASRRPSFLVHEQTMPKEPLGYEVVGRALYLDTDEDLFRLSWGLEPQYGVYVSRNFMSDNAPLEDRSEEEPWNRLVGQGISEVRCYWRRHAVGEQTACIPRDLEITLEDGFRLYLSVAHPGKDEQDVSYLHQLIAYHGEHAAWQYQIGPFADGSHPTGPL